MIVYPAIDIKDGRCVRLIEGDFARATTFDADPVDAARRWAAGGAEWLHVVDLDGAATGRPVNIETVARIRAAVAIPIQLGGGLRSAQDLQTVFGLGIDRAILGTAALGGELVERAVAGWAGRIAAGLDARDGRLATNGWLEQTDIEANTAAMRLRALGIEHVIFTDIRRDGTLSGPNLAALSEMVTTLRTGVIASGGIGTLGDIEAVAAVGAAGVVVGRALYDGRVDLAEAIDLARSAKVEAAR